MFNGIRDRCSHYFFRLTKPFAAWLILICLSLAYVTGYAAPIVEFKISAQNAQTTKLITHLVERYHYQKPKLDNELSSVIFEAYLQNLDPNRSYFLASDIEQFESLRYTFDDLLKSTNLMPAYAMFSVYRRRALERISYAQIQLAAGFNFQTEDEYLLNRESEPWPTTIQELDKIWTQRLKYDWLALKLSGRSKEQIADTLKSRYKHIEHQIGQISENDAFELVVNTYLSSIETHTNFFSPHATENFKIRMSLSLEGIGAVLQMINEHTLIHRILPGGPAALSNKLNSGDRITGVGQGDDQDILDVVGWRLDDVVDLIRGPKESIVRLEILPKTEPIGGKTRVVKIRRDTIRLEEQAAKQSLLNISIEGAIKIFGVITIPTFYVDFDAKGRGDKDYRSTTRDVRALILELEEYDIDGLIVDLRGNGGGALSEAISVTGLFIKSGPIVQVRESQGKVNIRKDPDPNILYSGPLIILVDRDSASASEIFAGALQDYKRGLVVGEPTFGKGTVQNLVDLDQFSKNNSAGLGQLKVTIAQFFRISGDGTQHRGVVPDLLLPEVQYRRDQRESSNINAMPWSAIKPTRYREFKTLTLSESSIDKIYQYHIKRIQNNPQFQYLLQKTKLDSTLAEQTSFSLLETRRRTERDLQAQKIQQLREEYLNDGLHESNDFLNSESLVNELVLLETAHILSDIIKENSTTPR